MTHFQCVDQGSIPCTRTKKKNLTRVLFLCAGKEHELLHVPAGDRKAEACRVKRDS